MDEKNGIKITTRDRLLRAWENSTELVRDFEAYAKERQDNREIAQLFAEYAKDEAEHAAALLKLLREQESR